MQYKIVVDKQSRVNPSPEKRMYEINIEELRVLGDVYDSLVITKDETYVMRKLALSEFHVLSVLPEPIKQPLIEVNIQLFEGDNYIYLIDMEGNRFYAEYLIKNEFNDLYVTQQILTSKIEESAGRIELSVQQKLDEELTGANIILKINGNTSEAQINADQIKLLANDILTILANNAINLTTKNITLESDNFGVNAEGNIRAVSGNIGGFNLNTNNLTKTITGLYDYNVYDLRTCAGFVMNLLNASQELINIYDLNDSGTITSADYVKIKNILQQIDTNTKNVSGIFKINSNDPKNCISIETNGKKVVSIGVGGINSNLITTENFVCGYADNLELNNYKGINMNGRTAEIVFMQGGASGTVITPTSVSAEVITQTSLETKKKNIKEYANNALDKIKNSSIYEFNFKSEKDEDKKHIGFVIGDKYKTPNEVISQSGQAIEVYNMASILWKAVQEQQEQIEKMQEQQEQLQKEIKELKEVTQNAKNDI